MRIFTSAFQWYAARAGCADRGKSELARGDLARGRIGPDTELAFAAFVKSIMSAPATLNRGHR